MTDAYNTAVGYLKQKYDTPVIPYGDVPPCIAENYDDHVLLLLVRQYNTLSNAPKVELEYKLTSMEIQFEKRYT